MAAMRSLRCEVEFTLFLRLSTAGLGLPCSAVPTVTVVFLTSNRQAINVGLNTNHFSSLKDGAGVQVHACASEDGNRR
jgi:hypothetical protein